MGCGEARERLPAGCFSWKCVTKWLGGCGLIADLINRSINGSVVIRDSRSLFCVTLRIACADGRKKKKEKKEQKISSLRKLF